MSYGPPRDELSSDDEDAPPMTTEQLLAALSAPTGATKKMSLQQMMAQESRDSGEDDLFDASLFHAASTKLLKDESPPSSAQVSRYSHLQSSGPKNLECVGAALAATLNKGGGISTYANLKGWSTFNVRSHDDHDITRLMGRNGFESCSLANALDSLASGKASAQGVGVWARKSTEDRSAWHAYAILEQLGGGKVLAFDPDTRIGGLKVVNTKAFDQDFAFRPA